MTIVYRHNSKIFIGRYDIVDEEDFYVVPEHPQGALHVARKNVIGTIQDNVSDEEVYKKFAEYFL